MAVDNEWGGRVSRRKAELLASDVFSFFSNTKEPLYIDDLENLLEEALMTLNTMAEDGSIGEVAERLMIMHEECLEDNYQSIERMRMTNLPPRTHLRQVFCYRRCSTLHFICLGSMFWHGHSVAKFVQANEEEDDDQDVEDDDGDVMAANNDRRTMSVDERSSIHSPMTIDEQPKHADEEDDGWVAVSSRRNKG